MLSNAEHFAEHFAAHPKQNARRNAQNCSAILSNMLSDIKLLRQMLNIPMLGLLWPAPFGLTASLFV
jgi:hypothetical protein